MASKEFKFHELSKSNLVVDAIYRGGNSGNKSDDPIAKLMKVENSGGFRVAGRRTKPKLLVLYSSLRDLDWPDSLDVQTGLFTYFGDNKNPGKSLHDTPKKGNLLLKNLFEWSNSEHRDLVPPIFVFTGEGRGRDVRFRGLAIPGTPNLGRTEELVARWKQKGGARFQNYRSTFSILNIGEISRNWINDIHEGNVISKNCPPAWRNWIETGNPDVLMAEREIRIPSEKEQMPQDRIGVRIMETVRNHFEIKQSWLGPHVFERFATEIFKMIERSNVVGEVMTGVGADGGRDSIGRYHIGPEIGGIDIDWALEAKCWKNGCGVKETQRLISRLRHRQFGVFVTTSFLNRQAYTEISEDRHPIIIITGKDIAETLIRNEFDSPTAVKRLLEASFPIQ